MPATYDDVQTLVQSRKLADQIVRELEATTLSRPIPYIPTPMPPALEPEELLPPPPSLPPSNIYEAAWSKKTTPKRRMRARRRNARSHLHWAVLAMAVAIAAGLWRDPTARVNAKRQLTTETRRAAKLAKSVSTKLGAAKSAAAAKAKRVSARII